MKLATLFGRATTASRVKLNELVGGHNAQEDLLTALFAGKVGEVVTALGSTAGDAAPLAVNKYIHRVLDANATKGVILPTGVTGDVRIIMNNIAAVLKVYPATGQKIDGGTASASANVAANRMVILVYNGDTEGWDSATIIIA